MPHVCEVYPGICLTTEEEAPINLSQGRRKMPVGTMKTEHTEQNIHTEQSIQYAIKNSNNNFRLILSVPDYRHLYSLSTDGTICYIVIHIKIMFTPPPPQAYIP